MCHLETRIWRKQRSWGLRAKPRMRRFQPFEEKPRRAGVWPLAGEDAVEGGGRPVHKRPPRRRVLPGSIA